MVIKDTYKCNICNKEYPFFFSRDRIVVECRENNKLFITSRGDEDTFILSYLLKYISKDYTISWENRDLTKMYKLFNKLIDKSQCKEDLIVHLTHGCPYCKKHNGKEVIKIKSEEVKLDKPYIPRVKFIQLNSLNDLPTEELKKIFKDFNFKRFNKFQEVGREILEEWKKEHGIKD